MLWLTKIFKVPVSNLGSTPRSRKRDGRGGALHHSLTRIVARVRTQSDEWGLCPLILTLRLGKVGKYLQLPEIICPGKRVPA
jgi:hypothetical protein